MADQAGLHHPRLLSEHFRFSFSRLWHGSGSIITLLLTYTKTFAKSPKSKFTPEVDETNAHTKGYMHRLQRGLGLWGLSIIGGGAAIILAVLGFLVVLWSGEGTEDGRHGGREEGLPPARGSPRQNWRR